MLGSEQASMAGDDLPIVIDQDWDIKSKGRDAFGQLPDMFDRVLAGVFWVGN